MKEDPLDLRSVFSEKVHHVPSDRFTFAIRVRCDEYRVGSFRGSTQLADNFLFALEDLVLRLERHFVNTELTLGQVANVTHRSLHGVVAANKLVDGFCFGRRLDDDEMFGQFRLLIAQNG